MCSSSGWPLNSASRADGNDDSWNWSDTSHTRSVNDYYGVPYV